MNRRAFLVLSLHPDDIAEGHGFRGRDITAVSSRMAAMEWFRTESSEYATVLEIETVDITVGARMTRCIRTHYARSDFQSPQPDPDEVFLKASHARRTSGSR